MSHETASMEVNAITMPMAVAPNRSRVLSRVIFIFERPFTAALSPEHRKEQANNPQVPWKYHSRTSPDYSGQPYRA